MLIAEARIPTERASRYLTQLCRHLGQMSRMRHQPPAGHRGGQASPSVQHVDWSDNSGEIRFTQGTCTLQATPTELLLHIQADDEDSLHRLQDGITRRLETIGRRGHLTVYWQRSAPPSEPSSGDSAAAEPGSATASGTAPASIAHRVHLHGRTIALTALVAVAITTHLGLLGAAVATSAWTRWGTNIILAAVLVKLAVAGVHLARRRLASRGHRTHLSHRRPGAARSARTGTSVHSREHAP